MSEAVIVDAVRTPFGRRGGALREYRPDALLAHVLDGLLDRTGVDARKIEDVIDGTVTLAGEQGANPARLAVLLSKLPVDVPGVSLNRMCGSSQQAVHFAAQAVSAGDMDYVIGCGVESMSRVPMFLDIGLGGPVNGFEKLDPELFKRHELIHQGESAERIADKWGLSRQDVDDFAQESHRRAALAQHAGWNRELIPVTGVAPDGGPLRLERDEGVRAQIDEAKMASLKPAFRPEGKGVVTAAEVGLDERISVSTPELSGGFEQLLNELPESQREVLILMKVEGRSLEEVAAATGSSIGSVKQKVHRAYEKLRRVLGGNL